MPKPNAMEMIARKTSLLLGLAKHYPQNLLNFEKIYADLFDVIIR